MDRELTSLQTQVKWIERSSGVDNLHLTVAKGYVSKLLGERSRSFDGWLRAVKIPVRIPNRSPRSKISGLEKQRPSDDHGDPDPVSAGTAGDAARGADRGGGGDGGNPSGAHQAG